MQHASVWLRIKVMVDADGFLNVVEFSKRVMCFVKSSSFCCWSSAWFLYGYSVMWMFAFEFYKYMLRDITKDDHEVLSEADKREGLWRLTVVPYCDSAFDGWWLLGRYFFCEFNSISNFCFLNLYLNTNYVVYSGQDLFSLSLTKRRQAYFETSNNYH